MKKFKSLFVAIAMIAGCAMPAAAQFAWGPKVGVTISDLKFDKDVLDSDNRTGFTGGLTAEFMLPVLNLGLDASIMYVDRTAKVNLGDIEGVQSIDRKYIEIPVNLKYKIGLPIAGQIVSPYVFTGPSFAFLCSDKEVLKDAVENKTCDITWNIGIGVQLFRKLQIGASYGIGLNNSIESVIEDKIGVDADNAGVYDSKNRCWTITAAYLF